MILPAVFCDSQSSHSFLFFLKKAEEKLTQYNTHFIRQKHAVGSPEAFIVTAK